MPRWKEEEVEILTKLYPSYAPIEKIGEILNRTHDAVVRKATAIGLRRESGLLWNDQEVKTLKELYPCTPPKEISFLLNRSHNAVINKATLLGLSNNRYKKWMNNQILTDWQGEESASIIAARHGITRNQLIGKMWRLGERKKFSTIFQIRKPRPSGLIYKARQNKPKPLPAVAVPKPSVIYRGMVHLMDITNSQCKFIEGDDHMMCGREAIEGTSWCSHHYARTHIDRRSAALARKCEQPVENCAGQKYIKSKLQTMDRGSPVSAGHTESEASNW